MLACRHPEYGDDPVAAFHDLAGDSVQFGLVLLVQQLGLGACAAAPTNALPQRAQRMRPTSR
jgi:hypothetical protein